MADMSKKTNEQLRDIMQKESGADAKTARAAYKELSKREGDLGFTVTMILGGRDLEHPKAPPRKPKRPEKKKKTEMAKGGMANGKVHMYAAGGSVTDNAGLRALKKASPEAYKKITKK